ncbi:MAG: hypothetical protein ISR54_01540 [Chlorobium phaeobacteroides]|uniref:Uncharacterized protein n=1 Tax=Chlorobium phaeobacteroides (strain BS1) TaxID=331678 RepID=B3EQW1_CHLPB|nr:hypothetical protein [Chlorobium phaeobacteroides]
MQNEQRVKQLQCDLGLLHENVREMLEDKESRSCLRYDERRRVEEILGALHEDILVLEMGAEVIAMIFAGIEN